MKLPLLILVITFWVAGAALAQPKSALPSDVAKFIERRGACNYFAGEPPFDKERVAFLNKKLAELRCKSIGAEEKALMRRYSGNKAIQDALLQSRYATQG